MTVSGAGVASPVMHDRFRSFAERYVIERASTFVKGRELEEGWRAIQDAKKLYVMIADGLVEPPSPWSMTNSNVAQSPWASNPRQGGKP
jgi:hypothetical protein